MLGFKKEIYIGKDNDNCRNLIAKLKENNIKYDIVRDEPHAADIGRGAGVGRFGVSAGSDTVRIMVRKSDYERAKSLPGK